MENNHKKSKLNHIRKQWTPKLSENSLDQPATISTTKLMHGSCMYMDGDLHVPDSINHIRKQWTRKVAEKPLDQPATISTTKRFDTSYSEYLAPDKLMAAAEDALGSTYVNGEWKLSKCYNLVSKMKNDPYKMGYATCISYFDDVDFGPCNRETHVQTDNSCFAERRLFTSSSEVIEENHPDVEEMTRVANLQGDMNNKQRCAVSSMLKLANMGQNHLTRLVRGVLLSLGAEMYGGALKLETNTNCMMWMDYNCRTIENVHFNPIITAIWCELPKLLGYASFLPHLCLGWNCKELPLRIRNIKIPEDRNVVFVVSMGQLGTISDVKMTAKDIRHALVTYAKSMACEEILEQAFCIGSLLLQHEHWPAVHLPASLWYTDLVRPAMKVKRQNSIYKRDWTLRDAMIIGIYGRDIIGLAVKEMMMSSSFVNMIDWKWSYSWLVENVCGKDSGFLFFLDPFRNPDRDRIKGINSCSVFKYWYLRDSIMKIDLINDESLYSNKLYKRMCLNFEMDKDKKRLIEGWVSNGEVSLVKSGVSCYKKNIGDILEFNELYEWSIESERFDEYDD